MDNFDKTINDKVCNFYPGDPNKCIKNFPITKIKILASIVLIIIGILIIIKSPEFIVNFVEFIFKKFSKLLGIIFIVSGIVSFNSSFNSIISQ